MKLAAWRKRKGWTQAQLAESLGCSQSYVSQIERASNPIIPGKDVLARLYEVSAGAVQPNDFFDLPKIPGQRAA